MLALFRAYPALEARLPRVALADLPTPVQRLERFGEAVGHDAVYVKRDDVSGKLYGGNKVRKLEFLLGHARDIGAGEVMTFGCVGSNHATATAIYANDLGMKSISMLLPQPNAHTVRQNLLMSYCSGAELHAYANSRSLKAGVAYQLARHRLRTGKTPVIIPAGGSSPLGAIGFVNAGFELKEQVDAGLLPEPHLVYVAAGTTGTAVGLMIGFRAAGLASRVVMVRVTGEEFVNAPRTLALLHDTVALLRDRDPSFPALAFDASDILMRHDCYGEQYALYTEASVAATRLLRETESVKLEGTYTGKALAALILDARSGALRDRTALFWNTYNARDVSSAIAGVDYRVLPRACHRYFEDDVQPLDRDGT